MTTIAFDDEKKVNTMKAYEPYIVMAQSMSNITFLEVYLIDLVGKKVVYASDTLLQRSAGDTVSPETLISLGQPELNAISAAAAQYKAATPEKRKGFVLHIYTRWQGQDAMASHKLSIIHSDKQGNPQLVMGVVSPSVREREECIVFRFADEDTLYRYQHETGLWTRHPLPHLTNNEIAMLRLTLQGHSLEAIGRLMYKSPESVKYYRRQVFEKLNVRNITEALVVAADYCLL